MSDAIAVTYENGAAFLKDPVDNWFDFLFGSFLTDGFYESAETRASRFAALTEEMVEDRGCGFVAKATVFARREIGTRAASHVAAAVLNGHSFEGKREFFKAVCRRPDDVSAIFERIDDMGGKRSHAAVRGMADYLSSVDEYAVGKYKMPNAKYNMFDCINLTHATSAAIDAYKDGSLKVPDTWETAISACRDEYSKAAEWTRLVSEHKLGYLALLRNLRNVIEHAGCNAVSEAARQLSDCDAVSRSLVMPFQIYAAFKALRAWDGCVPENVERALNAAFLASTKNMPQLLGKNLVVVDVSGSMLRRVSDDSTVTLMEQAACHAVALMCANPGSTLVRFADRADEYMGFDAREPLQSIERASFNTFTLGNGTRAASAFDLVEHRYDRMFLFSDEQVMDGDDDWRALYMAGADGGRRACDAYRDMVRRTCAEHMQSYVFDLGACATTFLSSDDNVHFLTSLGDKVFAYASLVEGDESFADVVDRYAY